MLNDICRFYSLLDAKIDIHSISGAIDKGTIHVFPAVVGQLSLPDVFLLQSLGFKPNCRRRCTYMNNW